MKKDDQWDEMSYMHYGHKSNYERLEYEYENEIDMYKLTKHKRRVIKQEDK